MLDRTVTAQVTTLPRTHTVVSPHYKSGTLADLELFLGELHKWQPLGSDADQRRAPAHSGLAAPL